MEEVVRTGLRNRLLASLPEADLVLLRPHLVPVTLGFRQRLQLSNRRVKAAYFLDSGIASVVAVATGSRSQAEVAIVGWEGMTGLPVVLRYPESIRMPLGQYFEGLCQEVLEATGAKNVVCLVEVPPVTFDINRLTMSLLLNEAIINSVKHGLGGRERGTISIRLDLDIANRYALTIKDDGNGLESGTIQRKGLGSSIMQSLAAQLRGEITFVTGGRGGWRRASCSPPPLRKLCPLLALSGHRYVC
jgi:Histidine kinase-, DNA gyrase B-, and HSP90-like ATPase